MKWLLLILSLPTQNATSRMRAWRTVKASGAAVIRDGVYLLPESSEHLDILNSVAQDVNDSGGTAYVLPLINVPSHEFEKLFDRSNEYQQLAQDIHQTSTSETTLTSQELLKQYKKLRNIFNTISGTDFFPGEARKQTLTLLDALQQSLDNQLDPNEPNIRPGGISLLNAADYRRRIWATRKRLWVDRLASAWLIRRFIDPHATFVWLDTPAECPGDALGFDFDGARFSHVESDSCTFVTFENLLYSFGLETDPALKRFGDIVHALDVGGLTVTEASGLELILRGMRSRMTDDNNLLASAEQIFNDFYSSLKEHTHE